MILYQKKSKNNLYYWYVIILCFILVFYDCLWFDIEYINKLLNYMLLIYLLHFPYLQPYLPVLLPSPWYFQVFWLQVLESFFDLLPELHFLSLLSFSSNLERASNIERILWNKNGEIIYLMLVSNLYLIIFVIKSKNWYLIFIFTCYPQQ